MADINTQTKLLNRGSSGALGGEWEIGWRRFSIGENKEENKDRKVTHVNSASWNLKFNYFKQLAVINSKKFKIERFKKGLKFSVPARWSFCGMGVVVVRRRLAP